jgi:Ni/Co efflux regulator RcnB
MMIRKTSVVAFVAMLLLASSSVFADKGGKHGQGRGQAKDTEERVDDRRGDDRRSHDGASIEFRFGDQDRRVASDYYGGQVRGGRCPPGLAKKGKGCIPPGQAKKWAKGHPLPRSVAFYDLPHDLLVRMPPPPPGHRYVRVAGDILLIAVGSSMVMDAIEDIIR